MNTQQKAKFRKVMHEWKQGKLTSSHGKPVTDQKQAIRIAFEEVRRMDDGGSIPNNYLGKTPEQIWNGWDDTQRDHFILDHVGDAIEYIEEIKKTYDQLNPKIKSRLSMHIAQGQYAIGGKVGGRGFFGLKKGEKVKSANDISVGDILLTHSKQFNADNTIKITDKRTYGNAVHFDAIYWNPKTNTRIGNEDFGVSDLDINLQWRDYYFPKSEKKSDGGKITTFRDIPYNEVMDYADKKGLNTDTEGNFDEVRQMLFKEKYANKPVRLSPEKKKLQEQIAKLKSTLSKVKNAKIRKALQKKIDKKQAELDRPKLHITEKIAAQKGKFYLDVPAEYSKQIYRRLWSMGIKPEIHKLNGKAKVVVNHTNKLQKAYKVYSEILGEKGINVPPLSQIKGSL